MTVHHIDVNQIGAAPFHRRDRGAERRKIGGEDRWCDENAHARETQSLTLLTD